MGHQDWRRMSLREIEEHDRARAVATIALFILIVLVGIFAAIVKALF